MKLLNKNNIFGLLILVIIVISLLKVKAQSFVEEFGNINLLWTNGWDSINHSTVWGDVPWKQPTTCLPAYSGNGNITSGFWVIGDTGIINVWLIAPLRILQNGDKIYFYTHSCDSLITTTDHPDRLQVRYSLNGGSANVGTADTSVGDFTSLLLDINPNYSAFPPPAGFPGSWYRYVLSISGLSGPTPGRFAFRYFVEHAHSPNFFPAIPPWTNATGIGIDSVAYVSIDDKGVGLKEINTNDKLIVTSIPPDYLFKFIYSGADDVIRQIKVYNLLGEEITCTWEDEIDINKYPAGIYFYSVQTRKGIVFTGKLFSGK